LLQDVGRLPDDVESLLHGAGDLLHDVAGLRHGVESLLYGAANRKKKIY